MLNTWNTILLLYIFLKLSNLSLINGFYIDYNQTKEKNKIIRKLDIEILKNSTNKFPELFQLKFSLEDKNISINFTKIIKDKKYPISSAKIYTLDNFKTLQEYKTSTTINEVSELYINKESKSTATLVSCKSYNHHHKISENFKIFATVYDHNCNNIVFNIIPLRENNASDKQNGNLEESEINKHSIIISYLNKINKQKNTYLDNVKLDLGNQILNLNRNKSKNKIFKRQVANSKQFDFYIQLLLVTDYTIYNDHKKFTQTQDSDIIVSHMRAYFAHYINGVNQRFKFSLENDPNINITIKLQNILILKNETDSNWTNSDYVGISTVKNYKGREVILATPTLNAFKNFMESKNFPFDFDYAIGLFNKDLWSNSGKTIAERSNIVGYSYQSGICTDTKYSIAEEIGGFIYTTITAHELAHNLGSSHDGDVDNNCLSTDNYIMTPNLGTLANNLSNQYIFSNCTIFSFKSTLLNSDFSDVSEQGKCLLNKPESKYDVIKNDYPGKSWSPDDQCKMIYGSASTFCQYLKNQMCTALPCRINQNSTECNFIYGLGAAEGTLCDSGKICIDGNCVESETALSGECLYGDDVIVNSKIINEISPLTQTSCEQVFKYLESINKFPLAYCSVSNFKKTCCLTCKKYEDLVCSDKDPNCPDFFPLCFTGAQMNGLNLEELCPRTCQICEKKPIFCSNSKIYCENNSTCVNLTSFRNEDYLGYRCDCLQGYSGYFCEKKNMCDPNPCKNNGKCVSIGSLGFKCECSSDFDGNYCENILYNTPKVASTTKIVEISDIYLVLNSAKNNKLQLIYCYLFFLLLNKIF